MMATLEVTRTGSHLASVRDPGGDHVFLVNCAYRAPANHAASRDAEAGGLGSPGLAIGGCGRGG